MSEPSSKVQYGTLDLKAGRKQLAVETELWIRTVAIVNRMLEGES